MLPLVSILIPAYNSENFIADTITSAINQTWAKKEVIVLDDGSKDKTLQVAKTFESGTVKIVAQTNTGACGARNKLLTYAQGNYIQWLDADDLLAPNKIEKQLQAIENNLTSRFLLTGAFGTFFFRHQKANFRPTPLWQDLAPIDWILTKFNRNVWMNPTVWLVSRELTDLAGLWDERLSRSGDDDGEYIVRVVSASQGVKFVNEAKCYYRIGNLGSLDGSMGKTEQQLESLLLSLSLSINHLLKLENTEKTRHACINHLQTWLPLFYPERYALIEEINSLAHRLGGNLLLPKVSWKYYPIQVAFGLKTAQRVMNNWRKAKLLAFRNWDYIFHALQHHKEF